MAQFEGDKYSVEANPMDEEALPQRITSDPGIFGGKPIIRGMRFAVEHVLGMMAGDNTMESLVEDYVHLEREDVQACLLFAQRAVAKEVVRGGRAIRDPG